MPVAQQSPPLTTPAPVLDLAPRQIIAGVCGYISGNPLSPLQCPSGYTCTSTVHDMVQWACCNSIECQGDWRVCENNGGNFCGNLGDAACSSIYTSILSCPASSPACFKYLRSSSVGASNTDASWACGTDTTPIYVLAFTTSGDTSTSATSNTITSAGTTATTAFTTDTDFSSPTANASSTTSSFGTSTSTSGSSNGTAGGVTGGTTSHHHLTGGDIAGIAIGGFFFLLIMSCLWYCGVFDRCCGCLRKKRFNPDYGSASQWAKDVASQTTEMHDPHSSSRS